MRYQEYKRRLLSYFRKTDYAALAKKEKHHAKSKNIHICSNGSKIHIVYPGYKAMKNGKIFYDYRVDMTRNQFRTSLSHANIIVDIYNKCLHNGFDKSVMKLLLIDVAQESASDFEAYPHYDCQQVNEELRQRIAHQHQQLGKIYNANGNLYDLTIEELVISIFWIVIQEDINYPMPRYLGRKMSFSRYIEALHCIENNSHTIEEVIRRALAHSRVPQWRDMDYSFLERIQY